MFSPDRGATATYRTITRGRGCGWVQSYQAAKRAGGAQRLEMPARAATMPTATSTNPARATAQRSA
jgi:hypothetical protein